MKKFMIVLVVGFVFLSSNMKSVKADDCGIKVPCPPTSVPTKADDGGGKKKKPKRATPVIIFTATSTATSTDTPTITPTNTLTFTPTPTITPTVSQTITPTNTNTPTSTVITSLALPVSRSAPICSRSLTGLLVGVAAIVAGTILRFLVNRQSAGDAGGFGYSHTSAQGRNINLAFGSGSVKPNDRLEGTNSPQGLSSSSHAGALTKTLGTTVPAGLQVVGCILAIFGTGGLLKLLPCSSWSPIIGAGIGIGIIVVGIVITARNKSRILRQDGAIHACDYDSSADSERDFYHALTGEMDIPPLDSGSKDAEPLDVNYNPGSDDIPPKTPD